MKTISQIVENRLFRKFQGTKIIGPNHFFRRGMVKNLIFCQMSVCYANIFTSLMKTRAWFEIPGAYCINLLPEFSANGKFNSI